MRAIKLIVFLFLVNFLHGQTGVLPEELYTMISNREDILILDIRPDHEYSKEKAIPEAVHIPFDKLATELKARGLDLNKKIVLYDRTGNVGRIAVSFLNKLLYKNVVYVIGGYLAWQDNLAKLEKSIPDNPVPVHGATNDTVLDSLNRPVAVDSLIKKTQ